jgi:AcrR family transcriptional regulator
MPRPRDDDKRSAILSAAIRLLAADGLGVATAAIAKAAGISNGSLFTYFATKSELINQLYLEVKMGMAAAALEGISAKASLRDQCARMWSNWTHWAAKFPERRRVLALIGVSADLTPETRTAGHQLMMPLAMLLERARAKGPLRDAPMTFAIAMMNALAETTMDFMVQDPKNADAHSKTGFDALWRMLI